MLHGIAIILGGDTPEESKIVICKQKYLRRRIFNGTGRYCICMGGLF